MSEAELKLECLKLALLQAKIEGCHQNRASLVEIATQFYNHITTNVVKLDTKVKKPADKSVDIFAGPAK